MTNLRRPHPAPARLATFLITLALIAGSTSACARRPVVAATSDAPVSSDFRSGTVGSNGSSNASAVPGSAQDFAASAGDRVYFDLDSHQVRSDAMPRLDAQAQWLRQYGQITVRIEGNADERGTREYNLALGGRRAQAIRDYLIARGVAAARVDTISYGKERPIVQGSGEQSFAQNRNGHTAIISGAL